MSEAATEIIESPEADEERNQRILRHRIELFNAASKTEAFQELVRECDRNIEYERKLLAGKALGREPFDQREADYVRGKIDGMKYVQQVVMVAEATITRLNEEQAALDAAAAQSEPEPNWREWQ